MQQNLVVTQFAVPVAVPQYAVPVAPQSYVQYGGGAVVPAPAGRQATGANDTAEDRIAAKILARLTSAGVIKPEAIPSLVSKTCAGCHSGPQPKAGLDLSTLQTLGPDVRLKCIGRVLSDDPGQRMPPASSGKTPSAEDLGRLLQELSTRGQEPGVAGGANAPQPQAAPVPASPAPAPAERAK
ncbi:MAG TPA: c-type cytochrome domain-containing protein [Pirellulales bacterium]|nr:c-type cytochrome domain-containing protein [Pirellulales bacterium]